MLLDAAESQLVLVDYQDKLMPVIHEGPQAMANAIKLAKMAQMLDLPVWGTEQNPSRLGTNNAELKALCKKTLEKMYFSAVPEGLGEWLRPPAKPAGGNARSLPKHLQKAQAEPRNDLVLAGCYTHTAVLQTALELLDNEDYSLIIVLDCCASPRQRDHDAALDRLAAQGAELVSLEMLALEWLADTDSRHAEAVHGLLAALPS